ncbi:MAG: FHA domain-containing protein [Pseudomonadota bacterium]
MYGLFAPKGLRAEVTDGIDVERGVTLGGQRVTIGSSADDTLRLGAGDVVPGHLTLERRADGSGWDYFSSDRGLTQVDRGNPRTGPVRPGMWIRIGRETEIRLLRTSLPAAPVGTAGDEVPTTVPMPVALGILGAIALAVLGFVSVQNSAGDASLRLMTTPWVTGSRDVAKGLEACLAEEARPSRGVVATDPASAFWQIMEFRGTDPARARNAETELVDEINAILIEAHLLSSENKLLDASSTLRRIKYVLPVGEATCPILAALEFDLALLELRGSG